MIYFAIYTLCIIGYIVMWITASGYVQYRLGNSSFWDDPAPLLAGMCWPIIFPIWAMSPVLVKARDLGMFLAEKQDEWQEARKLRVQISHQKEQLVMKRLHQEADVLEAQLQAESEAEAERAAMGE